MTLGRLLDVFEPPFFLCEAEAVVVMVRSKCSQL